MNDTTESRFFTAAEVARCLSVSKATVLRHMNELPPEEKAQGSYRGKPTYLVSEAGLVHLSILITEAQLNQATLDEVKQGTSSAATSESSAAKRNEVNQGDIVAELRARIAAQEREISVKNEQITSLTAALATAQQATAAAQALHAATAEQLRRLTAQAAPEPPQDRAEPEPPTDTTHAADEAQEAASAATVDGATVDPVEITRDTAPEITAAENQVKPKAGFWRRLQYLFRGE